MVEGRLIMEVKSVERIHAVHVAQAVSYLRGTGLRIALVVNFNVPVLKKGSGESCYDPCLGPSCPSCLRDER